MKTVTTPPEAKVNPGSGSLDRHVRVCSCGNPLAPWPKATVCVECNRERSRMVYAKSKSKQNARRAEWYRKNIERARGYARARRKENPKPKKTRNICPCGADARFRVLCPKCRSRSPERKNYAQTYREAHRPEAAARCVAYRRQENPPDYYIKHLLTSYGTILKPSDIPQPLVEIKREQLKIKRLCKKSRTSTN